MSKKAKWSFTDPIPCFCSPPKTVTITTVDANDNVIDTKTYGDTNPICKYCGKPWENH